MYFGFPILKLLLSSDLSFRDSSLTFRFYLYTVETASSQPWLLLTAAKCLAGIRRKSEKMSMSSWSLASQVNSTYFRQLGKIRFHFEPKKLFRLRKMRLQSKNICALRGLLRNIYGTVLCKLIDKTCFRRYTIYYHTFWCDRECFIIRPMHHLLRYLSSQPKCRCYDVTENLQLSVI